MPAHITITSSTSHSSSPFGSFSDEEGSVESDNRVSSPSAVDSTAYSDVESWHDEEHEVEPSESASRPHTSQRSYRPTEKRSGQHRETFRKYSTAERPSRHHSESGIHRRPAPTSASSLDPSEDFQGHGRGYTTQPHYGAGRPAPAYAQSSYSGTGYTHAQPYNALMQIAPGGGYPYPSHGMSPHPFSPAPQPPMPGVGGYFPPQGMGGPGQVGSPYSHEMLPYQQNPYNANWAPTPGFMPHPHMPYGQHQWHSPPEQAPSPAPAPAPAAPAPPPVESDAEKRLKEFEDAERKAIADQIAAEKKAASDRIAEMEKMMKEHAEAAEKAKKEGEEAVVKAKKEAAEKAAADRQAEKDAAKAAEERAAADKKAFDDALRKEREKILEDAAAEKKAAAKKAEEDAEKAIADKKAADEKAAAEKKAIEDAVAKAKAEMEAKYGEPPSSGDDKRKPIKFKDAVGRKYSFPFHLCQTWAGMEDLIRQAFLHVDVIGELVAAGHYDLIGPNGEIILPQVWETMIEPDWSVTMHMWPMPEPKPVPAPAEPPAHGRYEPQARRGKGPRQTGGPPPKHGQAPPPPPMSSNWVPPPPRHGESPIILPNPTKPRNASNGKKKSASTGILGWMVGNSGSKPKPKGSKK